MNLNEVNATLETLKAVSGKLSPKDPAASKDHWNRIGLEQAFKANGLRQLVNDSRWDEEGINFSSILSNVDSEDTAMELVDALTHVMRTEAASDLKLGGYFQLTFGIGGESSPIVVSVIVQDGAVVAV